MAKKLYKHNTDPDYPIMEVIDIYFGGINQKTIAPKGNSTKPIHDINRDLDKERPAFNIWVKDFNEII